MNYDFPEVMMVGGRWRSARVYTRDDDTRPIITCTTFDSLAEHLAMSTCSADRTPMSATPNTFKGMRN
ncbi:hypothetical protein N7455_000307 [Penicillium solitum]|uniref:uncharacterized protein n=1 Tax=Penicillium solitum TaxID=60172 RepID=UPI0032C475CB|nr:hypothetical protein N7455_000307 [Penicillium solitum]